MGTDDAEPGWSERRPRPPDDSRASNSPAPGRSTGLGRAASVGVQRGKPSVRHGPLGRATSAGRRHGRFLDRLRTSCAGHCAGGRGALVKRQISRAAGRLAERTRIWRGAGRPWRPDGRPVFLLISHHCGGGTERHVRELGAALLRERIRPLLVRPSRAGRVLWEEYDDSGQCIWCRESTDDRESIART